jgi:hypothetical protein
MNPASGEVACNLPYNIKGGVELSFDDVWPFNQDLYIGSLAGGSAT